MRLHSSDEIVKTNLSANKFRFADSPKIFEILSTNLYSNPIRAVVRELSANCIDSHIAAGKDDVPFEIELKYPSNLTSPLLIFRDFGTGLTEEEIQDIYTVYGASTKSHSDAFVGAYGIGAKSVFSITKTFNISSCKDGLKTDYIVFVGDDGYPAISKISQTPIDKNKNGFEVLFVIKNNDANIWEENILNELKFLEVPPTIIGFSNSKIETPKPLFSGETWGLYSPKDIGYTFTLLVGDIQYKITSHEFEQYILSAYNEDTLKFSFDTNKRSLVLSVPIGSVDVSASRESLSYTKRTVDTIASYFADFATSSNSFVKEFDLTNHKNVEEILSKFFTIYSHISPNNIVRNLKQSIFKNINFNELGIKLKEFPHLRLYVAGNYNKIIPITQNLLETHFKINLNYYSSRSSNRLIFDSMRSCKIIVSEDSIFPINQSLTVSFTSKVPTKKLTKIPNDSIIFICVPATSSTNIDSYNKDVAKLSLYFSEVNKLNDFSEIKGRRTPRKSKNTFTGFCPNENISNITRTSIFDKMDRLLDRKLTKKPNVDLNEIEDINDLMYYVLVPWEMYKSEKWLFCLPANSLFMTIDNFKKLREKFGEGCDKLLAKNLLIKELNTVANNRKDIFVDKFKIKYCELFDLIRQIKTNDVEELNHFDIFMSSHRNSTKIEEFYYNIKHINYSIDSHALKTITGKENSFTRALYPFIHKFENRIGIFNDSVILPEDTMFTLWCQLTDVKFENAKEWLISKLRNLVKEISKRPLIWIIIAHTSLYSEDVRIPFMREITKSNF